MTRHGGNPLPDREDQPAQRGPRRLSGDGAPAPSGYRRGPARALLALAVALLVTGLMLPQGLILAAGLVSAGVAAYLFASPRDPAGWRPRLP